MQKKKGISLIVLVITIIVMIILAASVVITISNTGIIDKASTAKENMESASLKQELEIALAFQSANKGNLEETLKEVSGVQSQVVKKVETDGTEIVMEDMTYVSRGSAIYTIYDGKELIPGKIEVWNKKVDSKEPASTSEASKVMHIYSAEELKWLADQVNEGENTFAGWTIYLESDIDFGARIDGDGWETTENENRKWNPIGVDSTKKFEGTFDGKGHTIRGMYVNQTVNFGGLFGNCYSVKNLTVKNSYIKAASCAAAIAGSTRPVDTTTAVIENCHNINTTIVTTGTTAAGVVAQLAEGDTVSKCSNSGTINSTGNFAGGIVALAQANTKITSSSNTGNVAGEALAVAGIVGGANTSSVLESNVNSGKVTSVGGYTGGIVGNTNSSVTVTNNINSGNISSEGDCAAGIVGVAGANNIVTNNTNKGNIISQTEVAGGVVGAANESTTITNNENSGNVSATVGITGGIAAFGTKNITISNNVNSGNVSTDKEYAGGIVSQLNYNANVLNNINKGRVTTKSYCSAGIVAFINNVEGISKVSGNVNIGMVQGESKWIAGILAICNPAENIITLEVSNNINKGNIKTEKGAFRVAGIVANCNGSTVLFNNINSGNIDGYGNMTASESYGVGGIVGTKGAYVYIYNCFNSGNVKSKNFAGGIVGNSYPVGEDENDITESYDEEYIKGVYNTGTIEAVDGYAGGIFGAYDTRDTTVMGLSKQITNAYNIGEVKGLYSAGLVGGLAGVKNSINMGNITGINKYGVIANKLETTEIDNVYYLSGVTSDVGTAVEKTNMTNAFMQSILGTTLFNYSGTYPRLYKANVEYTSEGITSVTMTNEILQ